MIRLYGRKVANWFYKYCGEYSYNKKMSKDLLFLDPNIQKHIYATWTNGDGTRRRLYNANNDKYYDNNAGFRKYGTGTNGQELCMRSYTINNNQWYNLKVVVASSESRNAPSILASYCCCP